MFHYKDGLFFGRNPDGSVKIRKMRDATGSAALVAEMDIDPGGWASIVAHVSAEADFAAAAKAVLEFHMEGCLRVPALMAEQRLTGITPPDALVEQMEKLSQFILNEVPGEPSENEGAVDTAIRLIRRRGALPNRAGLTSRVMEALGNVSLCWDPKPTGVFDAQAAVLVGDELVNFVIGPMVPGAPEAPLNAEAEQPVAGASLPPGAELEQPVEALPEQPAEGEGKPPEGA